MSAVFIARDARRKTSTLFLNALEAHMKRFTALLLLTCAVLGGCNTMEGAGKDIQQGGQKLQGAADRNK